VGRDPRAARRRRGDSGQFAASPQQRRQRSPRAPGGRGEIVDSEIAVRRWLPDYQIAWLRPDIVAGLTLAAYLLPAGIGDASLARLPPEAGLYACICSGRVFWLFCSSRHTVITVTSALSLLIGASVGELSGG